jgi:hypothetical protein
MLPFCVRAQHKSFPDVAIDTLSLLTGTQVKYWDKIDAPPGLGNRVISEGWRIKRLPLSILTYKYSRHKSKKRYVPIETDIVIGEIKFSLNGDTMVIPDFDAKVVFRKLTEDSLLVHDVYGGFIGDAIFVRSKDQKQVPIPVNPGTRKPQFSLPDKFHSTGSFLQWWAYHYPDQ